MRRLIRQIALGDYILPEFAPRSHNAAPPKSNFRDTFGGDSLQRPAQLHIKASPAARFAMVRPPVEGVSLSGFELVSSLQVQTGLLPNAVPKLTTQEVTPAPPLASKALS